MLASISRWNEFHGKETSIERQKDVSDPLRSHVCFVTELFQVPDRELQIMGGSVRGESCLPEYWGPSFDDLELDIYEDDAHPNGIGVIQQPDSEGPPDAWKNGPSVCGPSDSGCIDPRVLFSAGVGVGIPAQVLPGQSVAGLGSADVSQVAIEAP